jgi:hypothetical protein
MQPSNAGKETGEVQEMQVVQVVKLFSRQVCPNRTLIRTYMIVKYITEQNRADKEDIR